MGVIMNKELIKRIAALEAKVEALTASIPHIVTLGADESVPPLKDGCTYQMVIRCDSVSKFSDLNLESD